MFIVRSTYPDDNEVEKGLGSFKQAVKLKHTGGKGKKRKNMPGYTRGTNSLGRTFWKPVEDIEAIHRGPSAKAKYITELSRPGDVIKHENENYVVLGRLRNQLVVLDPVNSHVKTTSLTKEPDVVVRHNEQTLFSQDPVLLQRKIIGHYMSVKDILEHPDNYFQAKELIDKGLLKMPKDFKLSDGPNMELTKLEPESAVKKKKKKLEEAAAAATPEGIPHEKAPELLAAPEDSGKRFQAGETFKTQDYIHSAQIGDVILTSKDTHWTVVGKGLIDEKVKDAAGVWTHTGNKSPVLLVSSDAIDGVYALQVHGNNRTYTMISHGDDDAAKQLPHLQKSVIAKSRNQGYSLAQLLDGSYVAVPKPHNKKLVRQQNKLQPSGQGKNSRPPSVDLDLYGHENDAMATMEHAKKLLRGPKTEVQFVVRDAVGNHRQIEAKKDAATQQVFISSKKITPAWSQGDLIDGHVAGSNTRLNTLSHSPGSAKKKKGEGLLDEIIGTIDEMQG